MDKTNAIRALLLLAVEQETDVGGGGCTVMDKLYR